MGKIPIAVVVAFVSHMKFHWPFNILSQ